MILRKTNVARAMSSQSFALGWEIIAANLNLDSSDTTHVHIAHKKAVTRKRMLFDTERIWIDPFWVQPAGIRSRGAGDGEDTSTNTYRAATTGSCN